MFPLRAERVNALHAAHLERLVHARGRLVAARFIVVVHQEERLHEAVAHGAAVGRGVAAQHHLASRLYGVVKGADVGHRLLAQLLVVKDVEVVEVVELLLQVGRQHVAAVGLVKQPPHQHGFLFGERHAAHQVVDEGRVAVDAVAARALVHLEAAVAEELQVIIKVAARYAYLAAQLVDGVRVVLGEQQYEVQLALKFVVTHILLYFSRQVHSKRADKEICPAGLCINYGQNREQAQMDACPLARRISLSARRLSLVCCQSETFAVIRRRAVLGDGLAVGAGGVSLVLAPAVLGVFCGQTLHVVVAVSLGEDARCGY